MSFRQIIGTTTVAFLCVGVYGDSIRAQVSQVAGPSQLPQVLLKDPRITEFDRMIDGWNNGSLSLPPKEALRTPFVNRLAARVRDRRYQYETAEWQQALVGQFDRLPETVKPIGKITAPASQILRLLLAKNIAAAKPDMKADLELSLFLILGTATLKPQEVIGPELMLNSVVALWTGVWPFCE